MGAIMEYILAIRPWSLTAALIPIVTTATVLGTSYTDENFIRAVVMGIFIQIGANLTNTYYDYVNGVDTKDGGEKTLVERKVSTTGIILMSIISYLIGLAALAPYILSAKGYQLLTVVVTGICLSIFYTANPVGLKYKALGDITIFLCFGPLLMQCTSIMLIGSISSDLNIYTIPLGLIIEAILHANNARDIKADTKAGAVTLASILGFDGSYIFFVLLYVGAYVSAVYISAMSHWGCLATLLTAPIAASIVKLFKDKKMEYLPDEVAKMFLPFGALFVGGILMTSHGFLL
eukprot:gene6006-12111_t